MMYKITPNSECKWHYWGGLRKRWNGLLCYGFMFLFTLISPDLADLAMCRVMLQQYNVEPIEKES